MNDGYRVSFNLDIDSKICRILGIVTFVKLISKGGVIGVGDDRNIRIWIKIDKDQYRLTVCHMMPANITSFQFYEPSHKVFVGLAIGCVGEYFVNKDLSKLNHIRNYNGHKSFVSCLFYSAMHEMLITGGQDKALFWHNIKTGMVIGSVINQNSCTALDTFDSPTKLIFLGDSTGDIHMIKIEDSNGYKPIAVLYGHISQVTKLLWDPVRMKLYSGSDEGVIHVWDIGGKGGKLIRLEGHTQKITSLCLGSSGNFCLSSSMDGKVIAWNLTVQRKEANEWHERDACENCGKPFFWNFKSMIEGKTIGVRQHHCRQCGKALCHDCCNSRSTLPEIGYEVPVRVCKECSQSNDPASTSSPRLSFKNDSLPPPNNIQWSVIQDTHHAVVDMDMNETDKRLATSGSDKIIKVWDVTSLFG